MRGFTPEEPCTARRHRNWDPVADRGAEHTSVGSDRAAASAASTHMDRLARQSLRPDPDGRTGRSLADGADQEHQSGYNA